MKTWEVMKMLAENPNLKFKNLSFDYGKNAYLCRHANGFYRLNNVKQLEHDEDLNHMFLNANDEWEIFDEEVDFMTAIKAHNQGKEIYCLIGDTKYTYQPTMSTLLQDGDGLGMTSDEILKGEWHINYGV
jgi:hypothetical protein